MPLLILPKKTFTTNLWSGGTTTELFIHPKKSSYAERNFDFRLSMATVEVDESEFTPLPDIRRKTLILDGEIELRHNDEQPETFGKQQVASYEGDWLTSSLGRCTDFNLMTRGLTKGTLEGALLENEEQLIVQTSRHSFLYVYRGRIAIISGKQAEMAEEGSLIVADESCGPHLIIKAFGACELAVVHV